MNQKKCKTFRKVASIQTKGMPERQCMLDERSRKEYHFMRPVTKDDGSIEFKPVSEKYARSIVLAPSMRHFYHLLKKQYGQWSREGVIKARQQKLLDREHTRSMLLREEAIRKGEWCTVQSLTYGVLNATQF
jgi:hypothetical protein